MRINVLVLGVQLRLLQLLLEQLLDSGGALVMEAVLEEDRPFLQGKGSTKDEDKRIWDVFSISMYAKHLKTNGSFIST